MYDDARVVVFSPSYYRESNEREEKREVAFLPQAMFFLLRALTAIMECEQGKKADNENCLQRDKGSLAFSLRVSRFSFPAVLQ